MSSAASDPLTSRRRFAQHLAGGSLLAALAPAAGEAQVRSAAGHAAVHGGGVPVFDPMAFGAKGDGQAKDTHALQTAIDRCAAGGGGIVYLPPRRRFVSGTLILRSHVEFHLADGAVLQASPDRDDFRALGSLLFAQGEEGVCISGRGCIDGNFAAFFPPKGPNGYAIPQPFLGPFDPLYGPSSRNPPDGRPRMILLVGCRHTLLEDFEIRDSPTWTIHPVGCDDLRISGISILNSLEVPNCDGIDVDHCRNVRIEGCNIVAGDDCLVVKASRNFGEYGPCEGVTIANCTLESSSAGIKVETEGAYPLRSVVMSGCSIVRSNRGISFLNRDGAVVEDMLFTDMTIETRMRPLMWWGSGEPIAVSSVPRQKGGPAGQVRGISFVNMLCRSESGVYLRGSVGAPLKDISLRNIDLRLAKTTSIKGGFYDMRPGDAFGDAGLDVRSTAGVFAADVDGLALSGVSVHWEPNPPAYYGAAVEMQRCSGVSLAQVVGEAARAGAAPAVFEQVRFAREIVASD